MNEQEVTRLALSLNDSELSDLMFESFKHTKVFAQQFLGERFYSPFSELHDEIFDLIDSGEPYVAIAAPRGIGKTSIVGLALTAKRIMFTTLTAIHSGSTSHSPNSFTNPPILYDAGNLVSAENTALKNPDCAKSRVMK